ncbi:hypothetical protein OPT61_g373 [Boeremia exigua]|uniref:Uncharacterized protein n=1 Tax=Boeremia exigua TaxID=749465 RepID=A0ACC2IU10_9PLEO|nr:hypothetical protein OPT61_g373 [Boeremia exigua]
MEDGDAALVSAACYSPLKYASRIEEAQFRIATLLPGEWSERIECRLAIHGLREPPPYKTISYAWGDSQDSSQVIVNDVEITVPSSLELCLRYLRSNEAAIDLWTDAICIDQSNLIERASQVMHMGYIYRSCSLMYIWLGEPGLVSQSGNPFEMLLHWMEDKHFHDYPGFSRSQDTGEWIFEDNASYQKMYEVFYDFVSKPWWTRLWCVQELALCPEAVVVMGSWQLPWEAVLKAKENHARHDAGCCAGIPNSMPARYTYFPDHMLYLSQELDLTRMDQIVRALRHKLCKDPRDKIYGLLGLLSSTPIAKILPEYSWPIRDVYLMYTKEVVRQSNSNLQFLTGSGLGSTCHQLPSWVRDFAAPLRNTEASHENCRYENYEIYDASARSKGEATVTKDDELSLSGTFVDRIESVGTVLRHREWIHIIDTVQSWAQLAGLSSLDRCPNPTLLQERFWRTILADYMPTGHSAATPWSRITTPVNTAVFEWFFDIQERLQEGLEPHVSASLHALWLAADERCFFRTEKGHFGLCFPHTRPGDEVWVLAGGRVPFVLRSADALIERHDEVPQKFRLIGECYLHNFMDGQACGSDDKELEPILLV